MRDIFPPRFALRRLLAATVALALLTASATCAFAQRIYRPVHPVRPLRPIVPLFQPYPFFFYQALPLAPLGAYEYHHVWLPPLPVYYPPIYVYGDEGASHPQLALKNGTIYSVTDYWLVDNQLHFRTLEESDSQSVEHVIPLGELDLQKTADLDARAGFRFVLRNEPIGQYLRDHPNLAAPSPVPSPRLPPPK